MSRKYYDWPATFSRQTGTQGEICIVVGAKNIGKTFGIRKFCIEEYLKKKKRFCEICRTNVEVQSVQHGYFDKLQAQGLFKNYLFKTGGGIGYIAEITGVDEDGKEQHGNWEIICYFVALSNFQREKKRTFTNVGRFIFDEAIIDTKDRYHRYLPQEFLIFANLLDTISRQQPDGEQYRVYILGNACDLTAPYMRYLGINRIPEFGYSFWKNKSVLLHYVKPWDKKDMQAKTLAGRLLSGTKESEMVYGNKFSTANTQDVEKKSKAAKYRFALKYAGNTFAIWIDLGSAKCFICSKLPKDAPRESILTLTKADATLDYQAVDKSNEYLKLLSRFFYHGFLRYDTIATKELFLNVLDFLGVK